MDAGGGVRNLKAAQDKSAAVYLGTFNSGAAKISIPVLNEAGVPNTLTPPANTYVGLTTNHPGSEPGEPDIYYPSGKRNYTRIVPKDTIQGGRAGDADEAGRVHEGRDGQRQGGLRGRARARHRAIGAEAGARADRQRR